MSAEGDITTAVDKVDRLAQAEQQQQSDTPCFTTHELPAPDAIAKESAQLANMSRSGRRKVWAQHRVMFLPLELAWLLPITSAAWSQLQLIPNIIYRLDSMLQAVSVHGQLRELLHGGGAAAAAKVYNAPAGPDAADLKLAAGDGWVQPAGMHVLMSGVSHRQLLSQPDQQQPDRPEGQAADVSPDSQAAVAVGAKEHDDSRPNGLGSQAAATAVAGNSTQTGDKGLTAAAPMGVGIGGSNSRDGLPAINSTPTAASNASAGAPAVVPEVDSSGGISGMWHDVPLPSPTLLLVSLTASSCHETFDLERLEFLGDVILKVLTSHVLLKVGVRRWVQGYEAGATHWRTSCCCCSILLVLAACQPTVFLSAAGCTTTIRSCCCIDLPTMLNTHCHVQGFPPDANEGELSVAKARIIRNLRLAQLGRSAPLYLQYQLRSFPYDNSLWTPTGTQSVLGLFEDGRTYTCKGKRIADGVESLIGAFYIAGAAKEAALKVVAAGAGPGGDSTAATAAAAAGLSGNSSADVTSWVWHRVSRGGLVAAAAFCEVVGVLPAGESGP